MAYKTQCIALFLEEFCIYILKLRWIPIFLFNNLLFCIVKYDSYVDGENCFHYSKMQLNVGIIRREHSEKSLKNMEAGWKGNWHYLYYRIAAVLILLHYYRGLSILQYYFYINYFQVYEKGLLLQLSEAVRERIYVLNQIYSQYIWRILTSWT